MMVIHITIYVERAEKLLNTQGTVRRVLEYEVGKGWVIEKWAVDEKWVNRVFECVFGSFVDVFETFAHSYVTPGQNVINLLTIVHFVSIRVTEKSKQPFDLLFSSGVHWLLKIRSDGKIRGKLFLFVPRWVFSGGWGKEVYRKEKPNANTLFFFFFNVRKL